MAIRMSRKAGFSLGQSRRCARTLGGFLMATSVVLSTAARPASGASVTSAPPLPAPTGTVLNVSTESQLQAAVDSLTSNTTILIAPGTYNLTSTLWVNGSLSDVVIRGATNTPSDVVLVGKGMANAGYGNVPHGIWAGGGVLRLMIANLTIRDVYYHPIIFNAGTQSPRVYNVHLINAGEQFIKSNPNGNGGGVDNGVVEYTVMEYATTARSDYTNGVDVHTGRDWVIRNNLFRNIRAPQGQLAGPAVLMWNGSSGTVVEGNTFVDCQREIALGLIDRSPSDHSGGVVRNNFIHRAQAIAGDTAIGIFDSPNSQVVHNSIFVHGTYPSPIEYRFAGSTGISITNNLLDGAILARDGGQATLAANYTTAQASMFVDPSSGDLHLRSTATTAIDRGVSSNTTQDWDGEGRPFGIAPDIGADEYRATGTGLPGAPQNLRIVTPRPPLFQ